MFRPSINCSRRRRLMNKIKRVPGLFGYWPPSEVSGTTTRNYAPSTLDTLNGALAGGSFVGQGNIGRSFIFDGVNNNVTFSSISGITRVTAFTIIAFCYANNVTADHSIAATRAASEGFIFWHDDITTVSGRTDAFSFYIEDSAAHSGRIESTTNSAKANQLQMVAVTFQANSTTGIRLYINGIEDANSPASSSGVLESGGSGASFFVGESATGAQDRSGTLSNVAIFNQVLTQTQILGLFRSSGILS